MKHFMQPQTAILRKAHSTDPLSSPSPSSAKPRPYRKAKSTKENAPPSDPNSMAYDLKQSPATAAKLKSQLPPRLPSSNPLNRKLIMEAVPDNSVPGSSDSGVQMMMIQCFAAVQVQGQGPGPRGVVVHQSSPKSPSDHNNNNIIIISKCRRREALSLSLLSLPLSLIFSTSASASASKSESFLELSNSGGVKVLDLRFGSGDVPLQGDQRLTFKEFFDHKFLVEPRPMVEVELSAVLPTMKIKVGQFSSIASDERLQLHSGHPVSSSSRSPALSTSSVCETILKQRKDCANTYITKSGFTPNIASDRLRKSVDGDAFSASMQSFEKDYVIVNAYFASMDAFSFYLETSVQDKSTMRVSICPSGKSDKDQGRYNAGLLLESFSVELVVLAIWKKALQICSSWLASAAEGELPENCDSTKEWITGFGIASISSLALSGFNDGIGEIGL
ncbi:serine/threonine-protein kinase ATG1a isoform X1 [Fagus crenata]